MTQSVAGLTTRQPISAFTESIMECCKIRRICFSERSFHDMSENELRKKYGDATILGIPRKCIAGFLKDGFTSVADADG